MANRLDRFSFWSNWRTQYRLIAPAKANPIANLASSQPEFASPLHKSFYLTFVSQRDCVPAIIGLLYPCRPAAITGFVMAIIINTLKLMIERRTLAHVVKKSFERLAPAIANSNAAPSISVIADLCFSFASSNHHSPAIVSRRPGQSMSNASGDCYVNRQASAATRPAPFDCAPQRIRRTKREAPAVAMTQPNNQVFTGSPGKSKNGQASKSLASQIKNAVIEFRKRLWLGRINRSHDVTLLRRVANWLEPHGVSAPWRLASF